MNIKEFLTSERKKKYILLAFWVIIALLSFFVFSRPATSVDTYQKTIASIDEKKTAVTTLTAAAATASTLLAAIPGDVTTPIANQIMDISSWLLLVVCVLVLEKSLLTVMGYLAFKILIPLACGFLGVYTFHKKDQLKTLAIKFIVFALIIVSIIPFSLKISNFIYEVNQSTIEQITTDLNEDLQQDSTQEKTSWFQDVLSKINTSVSRAEEHAKQLLSQFIDAIALFIITYCIIPIVVVLVVLWFLKFLFGVSLPAPQKLNLLSASKKREHASSTELPKV